MPIKKSVIKIFLSLFPPLILLLLLVNTKFTLWPEMMVYPYLVNNGYLLYQELINPYPPAFIAFLSFFSNTFNYSIQSYQYLTWFIALSIVASVHFVSYRIYNDYLKAFLATAVFTFLAIPFGINELWFDLVQTPFIIFSAYFFYLFLNFKKVKDFEISTLFFLISFLIKQQSIWLLISYFLVLIFIGDKKNIKYLSLIKLPLLVFVLTCSFYFFYFLNLNILRDFLFWAFYFPFFEASSMPGYLSLPTIRQILILCSLFIVFVPLILSKFKEKILIYISFALLFFAYPRFDYFHLIPTIALLSIIFPANLNAVKNINLSLKYLATLAFIFLVIFSLKTIENKWKTEVRFFEDEVINSANQLAKITNNHDLIYILNGPDQLLPLTNTLPPKPWADEFPWYLEVPSVQSKVVKSLEKNPPKYVVYKPYADGAQYDLGSYKPKQILNFMEKNYLNNYKVSQNIWLKKPSFNKN